MRTSVKVATLLSRISRQPPDYFVATTGNDTTGDGSAAAPWATITKALASVPSAGGVRVGIAPGTYAENTSGLNYLYMTRAYTSPVTVERYGSGTVTLTNNGATTYALRFNGADNLYFKDLTITTSASISNGVLYWQAAATDIRFINCIIDAYGIGANLPAVTGTLNVMLDRCTIRRNAASAVATRCVLVRAGAATTINLTLNACAVTGTGIEAVDAQQSHADGTIKLVVNGGAYTNTSDYAIWAHGADVTIASATIETDSAAALVLGIDGIGTYTTSGSVTGCTVSSDSSHAMLVGGGCDSMSVTGCTVHGGDYALIFKECGNCAASNNTCIGGTLAALYFKAAVDCTASGNTLSGAAGYVAQIIRNDANNNKNENITLTGNTIIATGSADALGWGGDADDAGGGICDDNTYDISDTSGNVGDVRAATNITDLPGLQAAWSGYGDGTNDANSTVIAA